MNTSIKLFYHPHDLNFGDLLSRYVIEKLSYKKCEYADSNNADLFAIGSVLRMVKNRDSVVWGSGAISFNDKIVQADYRAVRGPLSADLVESETGIVVDCLGDPALLLPKIYDRDMEKKYRIGIVSHYVDYEYAKIFREEDIVIINSKLWQDSNSQIENFVDKVRSCEYIVSTSLHGLIVADAYGIPNMWADTIKGKLDGDNFKFQDYFALTGRYELYSPLPLKHAINAVITEKYIFPDTEKIVDDLLSTFPYRK